MQPFYGLTKNLNAKVLGGALVVLALALFIPFTGYLTTQRTSTTPQADEQTNVAETSISLSQHRFDCAVGDPQNGIPPEPDCNTIKSGKTFALDVLVKSDIDAANLVNAQLSFTRQRLNVTKIVTQGSTKSTPTDQNTAKVAQDFFVSSWVNRVYNNDQASIQLIGAVPNPGFITTKGESPATMARIYFKVISSGPVSVQVEENSSIYRNADNANILNITRDFEANAK